MRMTTTILALAATILSVAGCSDSNAPTPAVAGRYGLVSVNDQPIMLTLVDTPTLKVTVTDGALTLRANSTFTHELTLAVIANGFPGPAQQLSCGGTYSRSGNTLTMTGNETEQCSGITATGVLDGRTLTVSDDQGERLVFRR